MWLLAVFEFVFVAMFVVFVFSQIVVPLWRGRRLFPLLRGRRNDLGKEYADAGEDIDEARLEDDVSKRRRRADNLRNRRSTGRGTRSS